MYARIMGKLNARRQNLLEEGEKGFTLIELLVVVIIIGILAAIAIPIYIGVQNNAKDSAVKSDLTNVKTALVAAYTQNNQEPLPTTLTPATTLSDTKTTLGSLGATASADYSAPASAPAVASGSTMTSFCIAATSSTKTTFHISSSKGVDKDACPTDSKDW